MACCHAITYVNNELVGDPLEIKMFEMSKWKLEEDNSGSNSITQLDDIILANAKSPDG
jgi:magnesium-transporting ATPase (P-type)